MGNYRFRLADMMPNAWFYKLKDMGRATRNQSVPHTMRRGHLARGGGGGGGATTHPMTPKPFLPQNTPPKQVYAPSRASFYVPSKGAEADKFAISPVHHKGSDTHFPIDPPRKSKRRSRTRPARLCTKLASSPVSSTCSCRQWRSAAIADWHDGHTDNDEDDEFSDCSCRVTSSATDIIIDMGGNKLEQDISFKDIDTGSRSDLELPPILTKPPKECDESDGGSTKTPAAARKTPAGIHRVKVRTSSPRMASRRLQAVSRGRKSSAAKQQQQKQRRSGLSESFAVVKNSSDPQRDFRDSMVEMIVENNIRASKDLEELLACYLSLNSNQYHDVIVKVFEQIWFDLTDIRL